nr:hypothetical protein [uncultured Kingella sp.]
MRRHALFCFAAAQQRQPETPQWSVCGSPTKGSLKFTNPFSGCLIM